MGSEKYINPIHPGEVLRDDFIEDLGLSQNKVAKAIGVPNNRINQICNETRAISGDTALRLGKYFGTGADFWMNLQKLYDLGVARIEAEDTLDFIVPFDEAPKVAAG